MLYFAQTPYDDPLGDPFYRLACVDARYVEERDLKVPAAGRFEIPTHRPADTYRASSVLRPNRAVCHASVNQDCGLDTWWCRFSEIDGCQCYRPPRTATEDQNGVLLGACPACANGEDDDGDGLTDYPYDPDCFDSTDQDEGPNNACSNGIDDDEDGRRDWPADPGCEDAYDNDETDPAGAPPECADGEDNDNDGGIDFPNDPGCYAAVDNTEGQDFANPSLPCSDGEDNDGDGLVDLADSGCFDANDVDEQGPAVCFYCEQITANLPGQCNLGAERCKPRSGIPLAGPCNNNEDCRGAVCDTDTGRCQPCLDDGDCGDGVCDPIKGWCLTPSYEPTPCVSNGHCAAGLCDTSIGYCGVDPYHGCHRDEDCRTFELCSPERGFCLERVFATAQCDDDIPCGEGSCDEKLGWCLPTEESDQCRHDDECPYGDCLEGGYCDQQTFVTPEHFDPVVDCLRAR